MTAGRVPRPGKVRRTGFALGARTPAFLSLLVGVLGYAALLWACANFGRF